MTPYRNWIRSNGHGGVIVLHDWREELMRRLCWAHGDLRAEEIMHGFDQDTEDDLAAWRGLGGRPIYDL